MKRHIWLAIIASALGFFVDLYDIIILIIVRSKSLLELGVPQSELLSKGVRLGSWIRHPQYQPCLPTILSVSRLVI